MRSVSKVTTLISSYAAIDASIGQLIVLAISRNTAQTGLTWGYTMFVCCEADFPKTDFLI